MEPKKSHAADLERSRPQRLALGFALAAGVFLLALHLPLTGFDNDIDESLLEELAQDMEMMPALQQNDMVATVTLPEDKPEVIEKVNPVEKEKTPEPSVNTQLVMAQAPPIVSEPEAVETEPPVLAPFAVDKNENPIALRVVEQLPEFPGGMVAFMKWLTQNLKYPDAARNGKIQGQVLVSFVVNRDGTTSDIRIAKPAHPLLDREALRVMRIMPQWKPGEDHGQPCPTMVAIPVVFKL